LGWICRGICSRHKANTTGEDNNTRYADGQKRCQSCNIFMRWNFGNNCPCCGCKLRTKPRQKKLKLKLKAIETKKKNSKHVVLE